MVKRLTSGHTAVMASRAGAVVDRDSDLEALHRRLDLFPTPPWAARAGAEALRVIDPTCRTVREPACGLLHMAGPIGEYFTVLASDVHAHRAGVETRDWLNDEEWPAEPDCDWIFTNPPFAIADEFVTRGLKRARRGVALLLRLAFLEGAERHAIMDGEIKLTRLATFSERVPMTLGKWKIDASSATAYGWFFWDKAQAPMPPTWIAPGTRDRLWMPDDAQRYGWKEPLPLFADSAEDGNGLGADANLPQASVHATLHQEDPNRHELFS